MTDQAIRRLLKRQGVLEDKIEAEQSTAKKIKLYKRLLIVLKKLEQALKSMINANVPDTRK